MRSTPSCFRNRIRKKAARVQAFCLEDNLNIAVQNGQVRRRRLYQARIELQGRGHGLDLCGSVPDRGQLLLQLPARLPNYATCHGRPGTFRHRESEIRRPTNFPVSPTHFYRRQRKHKAPKMWPTTFEKASTATPAAQKRWQGFKSWSNSLPSSTRCTLWAGKYPRLAPWMRPNAEELLYSSEYSCFMNVMNER